MSTEQRAALPESGYPTLWLMPGRAMFLGQAMNLDPHCGSVACLAVGVDATFTIEAVTCQPEPTRSALIAPRVRHRLRSPGGRMVFCYLDPGSAGEQAVRGRMMSGDHLVGWEHAAEAELVEAAGRLSDDSIGQWLDLAGAVAHDPADGRILAAMQRLREQTNPPFSADVLAAQAGLSVSRFLHLFRSETGTSFRRYRMWARMLRAATLYLERRDLTSAAMDAGFASPSHFTDSFHDMFGLAPTQLLAVGADIRILSHAPAPRLHRERPPARWPPPPAASGGCDAAVARSRTPTATEPY